MGYTKQTWHDSPTNDTPITATALGHIEDGIFNAVPNDLVTAKGDVIGASASATPARVGVGSNRTVLAAKSGAAAGLSYIRALDNFPKGGANCWYATPYNSRSTAALTLNELRLTPLIISETTTFDRIAAEVTTAGAAGSVVRLGVYADDGTGFPGALVLDAGTINGTSVGAQALTISLTLDPGLYWIGAVAQTATATMRTFNPGGLPYGLPSFVGASYAPNSFVVAYVQTGVTGALPSNFTTTVAVAVSSSATSAVGLRAS